MKLFKVGFSKGGLGKADGCEFAPDKIVKSLEEIYLGERGIGVDFEVEEVKFDASDVGNVYSAVEGAVAGAGDCVVVGGDHTVSYGGVKGLKKRCGDEGSGGGAKVGIVVFDAHPDLMKDVKPCTHESWLRALIDEGVVDSSRVILIGLRNCDREEVDYLKQKKILHFDMWKIFDIGVREVCDVVMENVLKWDKVYLSVDIDVVDPGFAPGTGYGEPGGLSSREMIYFLQRLRMMRNLGCVDLVEVNPKKDVGGMTVKLGAKLLGELL